MDNVELVGAVYVLAASQKVVDSRSSMLKGPGIA
jgi:hypothetical protein